MLVSPGPRVNFVRSIRDKALLATLKEGQKVTFEFVQESDGYVVTKVK